MTKLVKMRVAGQQQVLT
jgi:hypothetical protein